MANQNTGCHTDMVRNHFEHLVRNISDELNIYSLTE